MKNTIGIVRGVFSLAVVAFIALVIWGVFSALDAASMSLIPVAKDDTTSASKPDDGAGQVAQEPLGESDKKTASGEIESTSADNALSAQSDTESSSSAQASSAGTSTQADKVSDNPKSTPKGSAGLANTPSPKDNSGSASDTPDVSAPQKTWHPAWDEWVSEGHFETKSIPATYGKREIYGSICRECSANISGRANQHLKDTHHSGFYEGVVGHESYEITPERIEQIWVDTSHWVAHSGYWE